MHGSEWEGRSVTTFSTPNSIKTLLDKTFRLFVNQKVPDLGVSGGKIQVLFP